jgi:hypothetical protein
MHNLPWGKPGVRIHSANGMRSDDDCRKSIQIWNLMASPSGAGGIIQGIEKFNLRIRRRGQLWRYGSCILWSRLARASNAHPLN